MQTRLEEAVKLHRLGQLDAAQKIYLEILSIESENAQALNLYGVLLLQKNELSESLEVLKKAVSLNETAPFLENLGLAYFCMQDFENAAQTYLKAFEKEPTIDSVQQLIKCYEKLQRFSDAAAFCKILFDNNPRNLEIIRQLASLYSRAEKYEDAKDMYKVSLSIEPRDYVGLNNAGLVYEKLGDLKEARKCYEKSLNIKENYEALHNLGVLARKERKPNDSIKLLLRALKLQPDNVQTKTSLGMAYFNARDLKNGAKYYKERCPHIKCRYKNDWDGEKHPESTLVIYFDGGNGDQIMFSRYIPRLKDYFKKIILLAYPGLVDFFKMNFPYIEVKLVTDEVDYDYSANIMELHYSLEEGLENTAVFGTYLKADENKTEFFREKYFQTEPDTMKVGLYWQGNPKVFKNRSIRLSELSPLLSCQKTKFYSFQKNDKDKQIEAYEQIIDLEPALNDFNDTAAALMNLDVVVTIDTAVAHLAGALGVKTFLLLPYAAEWRWFDEEEKTQWYQCVRIFRQKKEGEWDEVIERVFAALCE